MVYREAKRRFLKPPELVVPGGRTGSAASCLISKIPDSRWRALGTAENIGMGSTVGLPKVKDGVHVIELAGPVGACVGVGEAVSGPGPSGGSVGPPCWIMNKIGLGSSDGGLIPTLTVEFSVSVKK
jgi:hypothetical protein